jgi:hypothetical protein
MWNTSSFFATSCSHIDFWAHSASGNRRETKKFLFPLTGIDAYQLFCPKDAPDILNPVLSLPYSVRLLERCLFCAENNQIIIHTDGLPSGGMDSLLRSALFRGITQRRMVNLYRLFGTKYWSHIQWSRSSVKLHWASWPLKMGPIRCPETSVKVYRSTLRNTPEEFISHQHRGRSLKSLTLLSSRMLRPVIWYTHTDFSEAPAAFIFCVFIKLHVDRSQKTVFFIVIAVREWDLAFEPCCVANWSPRKMRL